MCALGQHVSRRPVTSCLVRRAAVLRTSPRGYEVPMYPTGPEDLPEVDSRGQPCFCLVHKLATWYVFSSNLLHVYLGGTPMHALTAHTSAGLLVYPGEYLCT